ncbi:MAG: glycosyl transferase, partial [Frankia sp.]
PRTDRTRAALILWGTWLIITAAVFSFSSGVIHSYYTVALAPAVAALVAIGGITLWRARTALVARIFLAVLIAATGLWDYALLNRTPHWYPELRWIVLVAALAAAVVLLAGGRTLAKATAGVALASVIALAAAPAAYAVETAATPHTGSTPASGPSGQSGGIGGGGMRGFGGAPGSTTTSGTTTGRPSGAAPGQAPSGSSTATNATTAPSGTRPTGTGSAAGGGGGAGTATTSSALTALLKKSTGYTWAAATVGSMSSASYQLASNMPVMAIGGFNGGDPSPTLAQFQAYVTAHKIHYFIASGTGGGAGGNQGSGSAIATWVAAHFKATTVGGQTVYDLTTTS